MALDPIDGLWRKGYEDPMDMDYNKRSVRHLIYAVILQAVKDAAPRGKFSREVTRGDCLSAKEFLAGEEGKRMIRSLGINYEEAMKGMREYYDSD